MWDLLIFILIGLVAGWIAGKVMKGRGLGTAGDIVVGIIGALIGGYLFGLAGIGADNIITSIIVATIGAIILLALVGFVRRET